MSIYTVSDDEFQTIHSKLSEAFNTEVIDVNFGTTVIHSIPTNYYKGVYHPFYGQKHSEESKQRMSDSQKLTDKHSTRGKKRPEFGVSMSGKNNPMYGTTSPFRGKKHSLATCPHCGKTGGAPQMKQWHFENCKNR